MKRIAMSGIACLISAGAAFAGAPCDGPDCPAGVAERPVPDAPDSYARCIRQATEQHLAALDAGQESRVAKAAWQDKLNECRKSGEGQRQAAE